MPAPPVPHPAQNPGMPPPARLLGWRILLVALLATVCWLAFSPHPPPQADTGWDKLNHLLAFAALAACACLASANSPRRWAAVPLALLGYGVFIELVQTQIPGRTGEWPDVVADSIGIAVGLLLVRAFSRWRKSSASWLTS